MAYNVYNKSENNRHRRMTMTKQIITALQQDAQALRHANNQRVAIEIDYDPATASPEKTARMKAIEDSVEEAYRAYTTSYNRAIRSGIDSFRAACIAACA